MADPRTSPTSDVTVCLLGLLKSKLEAAKAYDALTRHAGDDEELVALVAQMRRDEEVHVGSLKELLAQRLDEELGYEDDEAFEGDADFDEDEDDLDELAGLASDGPDEEAAPSRRAPPRTAPTPRR